MTEALLERLTRALPFMPPDERLEVQQLLERVAPAPPSLTFREYVRVVEPAYTWHRHNELMHDRLMDVVAGKIRRLAVFLPPRAGKSLTFSQLFTGYYQYCYPQRFVGLASATEPLAGFHATQSKKYLQRIVNAFEDPRELHRVRLSLSARGGGMWSAGVGGSIIGYGGSLLLADDLVKSAMDAASAVMQLRNNEWWDSTFTTRAQPNAVIVIVMTRWHPKDVTNYVLQQTGAAGDKAIPYHIMAFDAIRDLEQPWDFPANCTVEADWRAHGEALSPEQFPIEELIARRSVTSAHTWAALYQQRPVAKEGNMFKIDRITFIDALPADAHTFVRYWDTAATSVEDSADGDPDFTSGSRMAVSGRADQRKFIIEDVVAVQQEPSERNATMKVTADTDARERGRGRVKTIIEQQAGPGGTKATQNMIGWMAPHAVEARPAPGENKELRAEGFAAQVNAGNVVMVRGGWNAAVLLWLGGFPYAAHDDDVDSLSGAFNELFAMPEPVVVIPSSADLDTPYDV